MPCKGFQSKSNGTMAKINWYFQCPTCTVLWSMVAYLEIFQSDGPHPDHNADFVGGKASVSRSTGSLTVLNFQTAAEGLYWCQSTESKPYVLELKSAGEFTVFLCIFARHCFDSNESSSRVSK